jgi:hypothetical protein
MNDMIPRHQILRYQRHLDFNLLAVSTTKFCPLNYQPYNHYKKKNFHPMSHKSLETEL